jgi:hypothetical protein
MVNMFGSHSKIALMMLDTLDLDVKLLVSFLRSKQRAKLGGSWEFNQRIGKNG